MKYLSTKVKTYQEANLIVNVLPILKWSRKFCPFNYLKEVEESNDSDSLLRNSFWGHKRTDYFSHIHYHKNVTEIILSLTN